MIFLGLAFLTSTYVQINLSFGNASGAPGTPVVLNLTLTDDTSTVASVQWAMTYPTAVLWGLNANTISTGVSWTRSMGSSAWKSVLFGEPRFRTQEIS
jgi:hypothetical protein